MQTFHLSRFSSSPQSAQPAAARSITSLFSILNINVIALGRRIGFILSGLIQRYG
jgi:hypothetical protein